ncbi:hypothetical protein [Aquimarina sp. I32.4]|uniref:hypothetical protein n=1 Tax=Aquimarina sp. I32.4 TaxID=2053903 RepID=UPI0011AF9A2C|nr:hypothetical protein [Aquimarina sp. I32.4]
MRRICLCVLTIVSAMLLTGCQFSENLELKEDGSGKITINFDGSELMKMGGEEFSKEGKENVDSLVVFKDFLEKNKDSISKLSKKEQERLQKLKDYTMHVVMNSESKQMNIDMSRDFKDISKLGDLLSDFKTGMVLEEANSKKTKSKGAVNPLEMLSEEEGTEVRYSFVKNKFSRTTEIIDEEKMKRSLDSLKEARMFLSTSKYTLKYTFPRKIVKISSDKATFSLDMKTFILEVGFMEYLDNPKILDIEVELEK